MNEWGLWVWWVNPPQVNNNKIRNVPGGATA